MRRLPVPHWPSVRGRARADAGPLLLVAAVVAVISLLAGAVPGLLRETADRAVQEAVRQSGDDADVTVTAHWEPDDGPGGRYRFPRLAEDLDALRDRALGELGDGLRPVLQPPVTTAISSPLNVTDGSVLRTFRLAYLSNGSGPRVVWTAGEAPGPTVPDGRGETIIPYTGPPWIVHAGLSESAARVLGVKPGDRLRLADTNRNVKDVRVSGVFRPVDRTDPAWRIAPWLLDPVPGADGSGSLRLGGLLSAESLPDARLALSVDQFQREVRFAPDPQVLTWDSAQRIARTAVALKADSGSTGAYDTSSVWNTQLDAVLRDVSGQIDAASAQASVLLIAVLTAAVLILLLAAELLARRRGPALAVTRQRGAGLPVLAGELLLESVTVALAGAAVGVLVARTVVPVVSWVWVAPVVLAAVLAAPGSGVLAAARATRDHRVPANRSARRWIRHTAQLRRAAAEVAVLAAAAAAMVALHQRGVAGGLPATAPTLAVLAGGLLLLRLLPAGTALALRMSLRSRRPLAVFGAARAAATAGRALPLLALVAAAALASFAVTVDATVRAGLADGAWRTVGADARIDVSPSAEELTAEVAARLAAAPGVRHAVAGRVTEAERIVTADTTVSPVLVVVDTAAFRELLADTPLPTLEPLPAPGGGAIPALVRSGDGVLRPGVGLELLREGAPSVRMTAVGTAPAINNLPDVVIIDAAAGVPATPNTIWLTGPGARQAAAGAGVDATTVVRTGLLDARREAPLVAGLLALIWASAATLVVLGLLGLALGAAASAPDRWQTLSRLRAMGMRPRETRLVAAGELLPGVLLAAVGGPLLGVLLAWVTCGPLMLRLLTSQTSDPRVVLPWGPVALVTAALLGTVAVVVAAEGALHAKVRVSAYRARP